MSFFPQYIKRVNLNISKKELIEKISNHAPCIYPFDYQIANISSATIQLIPSSTSFFCYNSFIPNVEIEFKGKGSTSEAIITFELIKSIKLIIGILGCALAIFQTILLYMFFAEGWDFPSLFVVLIPLYLSMVSYLMTCFGLRYSAFVFIKSLDIS